jgi:hypothetical protein
MGGRLNEGHRHRMAGPPYFPPDANDSVVTVKKKLRSAKDLSTLDDFLTEEGTRIQVQEADSLVVDSIAIQAALEELAEGHLILDRLGVLKEDHGRELTVAERVIDMFKKNAKHQIDADVRALGKL